MRPSSDVVVDNHCPSRLRAVGHAAVLDRPGVSAEQNDVLLTTLRAIKANPEWDHRNWFDDVLKKLRDKYPEEFSDAAIEPCIDYAVNLLVAAPAN